MKKIILSAVLSLAALANSFACTNLIVGKNASTDGSTIVSYSADSYGLFGELYHYPAATYPKGTMLKVYEWDTGKYLGEIEQARQTYNVTGNMNEFQVTIGETTFGGRPELADSTGIIDYGSLIYIGLQRSRSAREAIRIMDMTGVISSQQGSGNYITCEFQKSLAETMTMMFAMDQIDYRQISQIRQALELSLIHI